MALSSTVICLLAGLSLFNMVCGDVRVTTQPLRAASYPAAGFKPARQFGLPAQPKTARLVDNSEAQEDLDDAAEEVDVARPKATVPGPTPAPVPAFAVAPTITYYPAGAVTFIKPAPFAKFIAVPPHFYTKYFG
ncbi:uncharacterized protein LOC108116744 [Drosophila eugracilis]|uniref:uncharacterized protein LOC108116744 n=1 Tax=Drosophila eugracilis TaxID=29029 RepID=UPI001BD9400D|nr:uncharacterized protein LOC108116744 [Drosophila eugracilis]